MSKRFRELILNIQHLKMNEQEKVIASTFEDWRGDAPQVDDVLVIGIKF